MDLMCARDAVPIVTHEHRACPPANRSMAPMKLSSPPENKQIVVGVAVRILVGFGAGSCVPVARGRK